MSTYKIATLLEKLRSSDKDSRYMAASDLFYELQEQTLLLDDDTESRLANAITLTLKDNNGEVRHLALKCLEPFIRRAKDINIEAIVDKLCTNIISRDKDLSQLRSISSIALKKVLQELPTSNENMVRNVYHRVVIHLRPYIFQEKLMENSNHLEVLEIIGLLLQLNGHYLVAHHDSIISSFFPLLTNPRMAVRKRAIAALSNLANVCTDELFQVIIVRLLEDIRQTKDAADAKTAVRFLEDIGRIAGTRFGKNLSLFVGLILQFVKHEDDELRECVLQTLEAFVQKCQVEVTPYIEEIVTISLQYLSYDPNYCYIEEMDADGEAEQDEEEFNEDDTGWPSWRVRRAALKCLEAVFTTRRELIFYSLKIIGTALISRFIDREPGVRVDVVNAFAALLHSADNILSDLRRRVDFDEEANVRTQITSVIQEQLPTLVKVIQKTIADKDFKFRQAILNLLGRLVNLLPGCLTDYFEALFPGICPMDKTLLPNIKPEMLSFLRSTMATHPPDFIVKNGVKLLQLVTLCVREPLHITESLTTLQELLKTLGGIDCHLVSGTTMLIPLLPELFACIMVRFRDSALDQESKESAILCMGQLFLSAGDHLRNEFRQHCLPIFTELLKNESSRLSTLKALSLAASASLKNDISPILDDLLVLSSQFLRKNSKDVRLATLELLTTLFRDYGHRISSSVISNIVQQLPPLIQESDLLATQASLQAISAAAAYDSVSVIANKNEIVACIVEVVQSSALQGSPLTAVVEALKALAGIGAQHDSDLCAANLIQILLRPFYDSFSSAAERTFLTAHRQRFLTTGKCVASLALADGIHMNIVDTCIQDILSETSTKTVKLIALTVVGEIGYYIDLSSCPGLQAMLNRSSELGKEDCRSIAGVTLGKLCGGNIQVFVSEIIHELDTESGKQEMLLEAIKELINLVPSERITMEAVVPFLPIIWKSLLDRAGSAEEADRHLVDESLGKLVAFDPISFVPALVQVLRTSSQAQVRCKMISAIRSTISTERKPVKHILKESIAVCLGFLDDVDLSVRRTALTLFSSIVNSKPALLKENLRDVLALVYKETEVKTELIRSTQMGPWTMEVDDGLQNRVAAYEALYTLLEKSGRSRVEHLDCTELMEHVVGGLSDHSSIKTLCFLFIRQLVHAVPTIVNQRLQHITAEISKVLQVSAEPDAIKQDIEKTNDLKRCAIRAFHALTLLPNAEKHQHVVELMSVIKSSRELTIMWEESKI